MLLTHARAMIASFDAARDAIAPRSKATSGVVHIGVTVALGLLLSSRVRLILEAHPGLSIDISIGERFGDMSEEGFDVIVSVGNLSDTALVGRQLGMTHRILVGSPSYLERRGEPKLPEDLIEHECITYSGVDAAGNWRFAGTNGEEIVSVGSRFRANSSEIVRRVVVDGLGLALLPQSSMTTGLAEDNVRSVMLNLAIIQESIFVLYPSKENLPTRTRTAIDFLVQEFQNNSVLTGRM